MNARVGAAVGAAVGAVTTPMNGTSGLSLPCFGLTLACEPWPLKAAEASCPQRDVIAEAPPGCEPDQLVAS